MWRWRSRQQRGGSRTTIITLAVLGVACLVSGASPVAAHEARPLLGAPGLPVVSALSCKLEGTTVVCSPGGRLLPKREKRLRPRRKEQVAPRRTTPASKPKSTTKSPVKSAPAKSQPTTGKAAAPPEADADAAGTAHEAGTEMKTDDGQVLRSCAPGHVVLETANEAGSFCEPVDSATPPKTESAEPPPSAGPGAETAPVGTTPAPSSPTNGALPAKVPTCCAAPAVDKASGKPRPGDGNISICAESEEEARSSVATYADLTEYRLTGPVTCKAK